MDTTIAPVPGVSLMTRELWWNIDTPFSKVIFYVLAAISIVVFAYGMYLKIQTWMSGKSLSHDSRFNNNIKERIKSLLTFGLAHKRIKDKPVPGFAHALVFFGFLALWITTDVIAVQEHGHLGVYFFQGTFYKGISMFADIGGLLLLIGLSIFTLRRYVFIDKSLDNTQQDWIPIVLLYSLVLSGFLLEAMRMAATQQIEPFAPVGAFVANFVQFMTVDDLAIKHMSLWWLHAILTFVFIASIPFTKLIHIFTSPLSIFLFTERKKGQLSTPFKLMDIMEAEAEGKEFDESVLDIGVSSFSDFSWKSLMDSDACTSCGRCHIACPATSTEKPLSPKFLMLDIRALAKGETKAKEDVFSEISQDVLWSCTTCRACMEECPVLIEHVDTIVDMRRGLLAQNKAPASLQATLKNLRTKSNPWGLAPNERDKWIHEIKAEGVEVQTAKENPGFEYLYWVGSPGAYDAKNITVTKANAKMFKKAGLNFAVLGNEEKTTGDIARRAGDEGLFQELALENIEILMRYGVKKIITQCPHAYNTLKNEYPELGLEGVEVFHHSEILAKLLSEGKLVPKNKVTTKVTYHDPCYLGRYNDVYDPPRYILESIPGLEIEKVDQEKTKSTCCGGGGAQIWYEMPGTGINSMRFEELNEHNPNKISTSCPYCNIMITTATKSVFHGTNIPEIEDVAVTLSQSVL